MGGKTDELKGRIKEAAGALTGNDKLRRGRRDRPGSREGPTDRPECRRHGDESRDRSYRVLVKRCKLSSNCRKHSPRPS